ncbi:glycosylphosphatidylinositol anchor attachment 1 protein-like [Homarus americanus]|uniref:glycosylphosphatidylinositol anchor attachment 1 protein-like n=1 Tax=Homarus americanus TaxID=6706 RepID=UPI001C449968|nr:glycosylphosphatidylinositol anchor attachment 1 protein-like [Homarus americanus]
MGLLTDPGMERSQLPALLEKYHRPICVILYVVGIVWFMALAHNSLNHGTYFSENALLPGLVQGDFHGDSQAVQYLESLTEEAEKHASGMPYPWLAAQFTQLGLDTFTHNFTLHYPMGKDKIFTGKNVYGILRASRGSSTEAVVVSAPYRPPSSLLQGTAPSIALMLAMAHFFSTQVYWAKDLIFLVTEHEQLGAQAWLQAYHRTQSGAGVLDHGDLEGRAGAIQAAINLELHSSHVSHIDVKVEGLNGQLPNLDLVNLIHRLCQRENVHHTFKNRGDHPSPETLQGWLHQLQTLLAMVASQASGVPTGNHGLFHRYGIAAVTVEGQQQQGRGWRSVSLHQLGRVLEGVCRSLNNLLERFHQSFFFYLLPATNRYISIGVYMPPFGMIAGGVLVKALALWYSTSCAAEEQHQNKNIKKKVDYGLLGCVPLVVLMHLVSVAVSCGPPMLSRCGLIMALSAEDSVFLGTAAFCLTLLVLPSCINRYMGLQERSWEIVKIFAVLELGVLLFAGAVYNFSLALIITIAFTPVALITSPSKSRMKWCLKSLLLILVHPLSMLFLFVMLDTWQNFSQLPINKLLWKSYIATKRALMYSVVDSLIYSNWVFDVATQCLLPVWLLFWQIVHYPTP